MDWNTGDQTCRSMSARNDGNARESEEVEEAEALQDECRTPNYV